MIINAIESIRKGRDYTHLVAKAEALFIAWSEVFQPVLEEHEVLFVEKEFTFPLLNPETEAASRTFDEAGKIDAGLRHRKSGQVKVLDHKTTSDSIDAASDYWDRLTMDTQISKYILGMKHEGYDVNSIFFDVVRKPQHQPLAIPLLDENGVKIVLNASGERVKTKDEKKWRETGDTEKGFVLQTRQETPEEHRERLLGVMRSDHGAYFSQREIPRLDKDLLEYMSDAWAQSQQILYYRSRKLWPRNPAACTAYGRCEFFALCAGHASVDGIRYDKKPKAHSELDITPDGKDFLTNSRLTALRKCARYHFLRYEDPTEVVGDVNENLTIGTLFHRGVEVYLKQHMENK